MRVNPCSPQQSRLSPLTPHMVPNMDPQLSQLHLYESKSCNRSWTENTSSSGSVVQSPCEELLSRHFGIAADALEAQGACARKLTIGSLKRSKLEDSSYGISYRYCATTAFDNTFHEVAGMTYEHHSPVCL